MSHTNDLVRIQVQRYASTEAAILVGPTSREAGGYVSDNFKQWLPLGLLTDYDEVLDPDGETPTSDVLEITLPRWLMEKKGLEDYECEERQD